MSYADVAAHNAPPPSKQPKADKGLLTTEVPEMGIIADDTQKVNVVSPDFKRYPKTVTGETEPLTEFPSSSEEDVHHHAHSTQTGAAKDKAKTKGKVFKEKAKKEFEEAEEEGEHLWAIAKEQLLRPGVAGGLVGLVNVGLLSAASYALYINPALRRDIRMLSVGSLSFLALFSLEGYGADQLAKTPRGRDAKRRAKAEGSALYRHSREVVLRPGILGGLVGLLNLGVLGGVGYAAYDNWHVRWDRRVVSAVSVGLLTLWSGEGYLAEKFRQEHH